MKCTTRFTSELNLKKIPTTRINEEYHHHILIRSYPNARYVGFYKFATPAILVRSTEMTKMVLMDNFKSFQANDNYMKSKLDPLLYMNPFWNIGVDWKTKRNNLTPIFTAAKVYQQY